MLTITKKDGDLVFLNVNAFERIEYHKHLGRLFCYRPDKTDYIMYEVKDICEGLPVKEKKEVKVFKEERPEVEITFDTPIRDLTKIRIPVVWVRFNSGCRQLDIETVGDLLKFTPMDFMRNTRNCGSKTTLAIQEELKKQYNIIWQ